MLWPTGLILASNGYRVLAIHRDLETGLQSLFGPLFLKTRGCRRATD